MKYKFICDASVSADGLNINLPAITFAKCIYSDNSIQKGKKYWEIKIIIGDTALIGVGVKETSFNYSTGKISGYYGDRGTLFVGDKPYGNKFTNGDTIGVAYDADNARITFYKNGISQGEVVTNLPIGVEIYPMLSTYYASTIQATFDKTRFKYPIPTGYVALNPICKYLLKQNDKFYTIKNGSQPLSITVPTKLDYETYGFDDVNLPTQPITQITQSGGAKGLLGVGKYFEFDLNNDINNIKSIE